MNGCTSTGNGSYQNPMLEQWDHVIVSISGGKDSAVLMDWALEAFPKNILTCVHAVIDIDWPQTVDVVRTQAKFFDLPLVMVQAVKRDGSKNGFLRHLSSQRISRSTGEAGEQKFPDQGNRWCTSLLKVGPIDKYVRTLTGNVLVLIGERRQESRQRAELFPYRPDEKNTKQATTNKKGRRVVKFSPLLDYDEKEVWNIIKHKKIPTHPCYGWGVSRASCAICIFSSNKEIRIAAEKAPELVAEYIEAEKKIQHTFRYKPATKKRAELKITIEDIINESEGCDELDQLSSCA